MTLEQNLHNGSRAKEVLENEQFIAAFEAIESELVESWKTSPARAEVDRERIWTYLSLLKKVKAHLVSTMETGKLAELELIHKQTMFDRARDGLRSVAGLSR